MGGCRESQNLFKIVKQRDWVRFWLLIKKYNKLTHEDTWMPLVCKIKGHKYYQPDIEYEPEEWACKRCHRFVDYSLKEQRKQKLRKLKLKRIYRW